METVEIAYGNSRKYTLGYKNTKSYYDFFKIIQFGIRSLLLSRMKSNAINLNN